MDAERLEHLLRALPPAPKDWVSDASELVYPVGVGEDELLSHDIHDVPHDYHDVLPDVDAGHDLSDLSDPRDPGHHGDDDHEGDVF